MRDLATKIDGTSELNSAEFNSIKNESQNIVTSADFTLDSEGGPDVNLFMLSQSIAAYANAGLVYQDSGTADAYILSITTNLKPVVTYSNNMMVVFKAGNSNTGPSTINVNSIGARSFTRPDGSALEPDDIISGNYYFAIYNLSQTRFELVNKEEAALTDPVGAVSVQAIKALPNGYLYCDGSAVSRTTYADLFAVIGTSYGVGDGSTTFNLPWLNFSDIALTDSGAPSTGWRAIAVDSSTGDVYACDEITDDIYKNAGGLGVWTDTSAPATSWQGITVNSSNGDVWACSSSGDIYKNAGGLGVWVIDATAPSDSWYGITVDASNGDVWVCSLSTSKIYKNASGAGSWVQDVAAPSVQWTDIIVNPNTQDVYACELTTDKIYKNTGGLGTWTDVSAPVKNWFFLALNISSGDLWAKESNSDVYKTLRGESSFEILIINSSNYRGMAVDEVKGEFWIAEDTGGILKSQDSTVQYIIKYKL